MDTLKNMLNAVDPYGKSQHEPGAKLDAGKPKMHLMFSGFSKALVRVADVTTYGADLYSPNGWKSVQDGFNRYSNAMLRHLADESETRLDPGSNLEHAAHVAWNALARLQLLLDNQQQQGVWKYGKV